MNRMLLASLVALATAAVATAAWCDDSAAVPDPAARTKVVCKKEPVMGTRIQQRVCKTQEQIDRDRENAKEATDTWQRDGNMQKTKG